MSDIFSVFVPGTPKPQPRPRAFARNGHAKVYDPATAEGWKSTIAEALRPFAGRRVDGPVSVALDFRFPRPKAHYRSNGDLRPSAPGYYHTQRPDLDNLEKAVLDALTAIGVWDDDAQIVALSSAKGWVDAAGAGCLINVRRQGAP